MNITFTPQEDDFIEEELPANWDPLGQPGQPAEGQQAFSYGMSTLIAGKGWLTLI